MEKILVFGKALWDIIIDTDIEFKEDFFALPFREKAIIKSLLEEPGGGAVNVSLSLKKLGFEPVLFALVGKDTRGEAIRSFLKRKGIHTLFLGMAKHKTGLSVVIKSKDGFHSALIYPGANKWIKERDFSPEEVKEARWWFILSWGNNDENLVKKIINEKQRLGKYLAFNPGKIQLEAVEKIKPLISNTDILFLNEKELSLLLKKKIALKKIKEAIKEVVGLGPKIVVITLGAKGSMVYDGRFFYSMSSFPIKYKDSLGAGDAYCSAFLGWFLITGKIEESLKAATINSASVVSCEGAILGQLNKEKIEEKIKKLKLRVKKEGFE